MSSQRELTVSGREPRINDAKERNRLKRATNIAIFELLQPMGFKRGRSGGSFRNFSRVDLAEHVYLQLSANGTHAPWSDWVVYEPWLGVIHEHVHGLVVKCIASPRDARGAREAAKHFLNQIVLPERDEWSVLTDEDIPGVAQSIAAGVAGTGLAFARSVQTLDGLISYLETRPGASSPSLPAAYAFAGNTKRLNAAIAFTVLFGPNPVLSYHSNGLASFAIELYAELERGLASPADYAALHRAEDRKTTRQRLDEFSARWPLGSVVDDLVALVESVTATAAERYGFIPRPWDSPEIYPYPRLVTPLAPGLLGELVLVPEVRSRTAPIRLFPLAGVTYEPAQQLYFALSVPGERVWTALPYTHLRPLHTLTSRPPNQLWAAADVGSLDRAIESVFADVAEVALSWMTQFTDLNVLTEMLAPLSVDPEIALIRACTLAVRGDTAGMTRQLQALLAQFRNANLGTLERMRLEEAEGFATKLDGIVQSGEIDRYR
jgi:hypothetical protein